MYNQQPLEPVPLPPSKYWGERDDPRHPGPLHWPGANGFPFLGRNPGYLHQYELDRLQVVGYKRVKTFDLSNDADHDYYCWVRDHAGSHLFCIDHESHHPIEYTTADGEKRVKMFVHLEWRQFYTVASNSSQGRSPNADATRFDLR